ADLQNSGPDRFPLERLHSRTRRHRFYWHARRRRCGAQAAALLARRRRSRRPHAGHRRTAQPGRRRGLTMPSFSLGRLVEFLGCELVGDAGVLITGVSTIEKAGQGELTFLANLKYAPKIKASRASAILAAEPLKDTSAATLVSA